MALPASGTMTLAMIQTEFGGSNPIGLNEYYKGGTYVPNVPANAAVPTSGVITFSNFYNATAATPTNFGGSLTTSILSASACSVTLRMETNGTFTESHSGSLGVDTITGDLWFTPATTSIGNSYWVRATRTSGSTPSSGSGTGTWLALSSQRTWTYNSGTGGASSSRSGTLLLEVSSDASGTPVVCSGSVYFEAYRET